ncbi:putative ATPase (AAA+ superfamily) [Caldisphaera lagunensis DSM 15908]|uniref:Putative ATPase (AAA+ superfamily) n=1 Tax=Caldisphaera lagunensis (strain DSM 15908 / JCM 11604 / ANMR 0165 / IC-154) TaxID=1056495 RepID=L0AA41_CALLD|nr:ATP-binding protein [Caldisphaera lagunensis]AFZ70726.1 putative ATPase (AAA+ superfamily) [Caldisphaera lagunensis DSM 15908]
MLFDITPKHNRKDFFDREEEIEKLKELRTPILLVLGLRRTGKSSLIRISLNELNLPYIYLDLRMFEQNNYLSYKEFSLELQNEINKLANKFPYLIDFLKEIQGIKIFGNEIKFNWKKKERPSFSSILSAMEKIRKKVIIVLDEAQELIKLKGINILPSLAYAYDNLKNIKIILSGSEMGMLYEFLKIDDPNSPLYGRAFSTIELKPFNREKAIEFLKRGFEEINIDFKDYETVYEKIGGIPGWLTYFGFTYMEKKDLEESINLTLEYAKKLIIKEFNNFLIGREVARKRYETIMNLLKECKTWSDVKKALELEEGIEISDSEVYNYLMQLMKHSWIKKENRNYCVSEPLISQAFRLS